MARIFICDNCKKEFPEPLDQEIYKDEHGVLWCFDMCAPCRAAMSADVKEGKEEKYYDKMKKNQEK